MGEQTITQEKSMEELGNRIDANQDHIEDLQEHDADQDAKIEDLTEAWSGMENKLTALESYQENKDLNDEKTTGILEILKENEKKLTIDVEELNKDSAEIKEKLEELDKKTKKLDDKAE